MSFALIDPSTLTTLLSTSQLYYEWSTMRVKILKLFQRIQLIKDAIITRGMVLILVGLRQFWFWIKLIYSIHHCTVVPLK